MSKDVASVSAHNEREIYRVDDYYSPHILADDRGMITICVGGYCIMKPIADWHSLAKGNDLVARDIDGTEGFTNPQSKASLKRELT